MWRWMMAATLLLAGCGGGTSGGGTQGSADIGHGVPVTLPAASVCSAGEAYRPLTKACVPVRHTDWGFVDFALPQRRLTLDRCSESALQDLLEEARSQGGAVITLPACRLVLHDTIALYDNTLLEGAGTGETILEAAHDNDILSLRGHNIVVRGIGLDGKDRALGGIVGTNNRGNILIEACEIKNLRGSGIYLDTAAPQADTQITLRLNRISHTLHGINVKTLASAKMLILSNDLYENREYGIDMSTTSDIEVTANYLHDNHFAGAKSPLADAIWYRYNDVRYNGKDANPEDRAGIVYMGTNADARIYLEYNDLSRNGGLAFATWSGHFAYLLLRENIVTGSQDTNGYNIRATGVGTIDVYGDHGNIWVGEGNEGRIHYH